MTTLRDQLNAAVDDVHPDLVALTRAAQRRGGRIKTRRRLAMAGAGLVVAAVVATPLATSPGPGSAARLADPAALADPVDTTHTAPMTGRSLAAALAYGIDQVAPGTSGPFVGQGPVLGELDSFASTTFVPDDGRGAGQVAINVQHITLDEPAVSEAVEQTKDATEGLAPEAHDQRLGTCHEDWMAHCVRQRLAGGILVTWTEALPDRNGPDGTMNVADYYTDDGIRVVVSASNGVEHPDSQVEVTRENPPLGIDDLTTIATLDWWGAELPAEFTQAGEQLDYSRGYLIGRRTLPYRLPRGLSAASPAPGAVG